MLKRLTLKSYRGFREFSIPFKPFSVIVGPNNAGKSTLIAALRSGSLMLNHAKRFNPPERNDFGDNRYRTHKIAVGSFLVESESLRHNFEDEKQTRIELDFDQKANLKAVWPGYQEAGFFFVSVDGGQPVNLARTRQLFPTMGVITSLRPVEPREKLLDDNYVKKNVGGRLTSLHFRNQLRLLDTWSKNRDATGFEAFGRFSAGWLPELTLSRPRVRGDEIDVFYKEGRWEREISWAGDGIQVFLQILLNVFLLQDTETLVLDEPELYLHPDLQRRLVELLKVTSIQCILATHSPEIIAASPPESVLWIDRAQKRAVQSPANDTLDQLTDSIGTGFNLRLARLMRTKVAFFVEGDDLQYLKRLASTLRLRALVIEAGVAVVPLDGSGNYRKLDSFDWIARNFLKGSIKGYVLFDRDFLSDGTRQDRTKSLEVAGLNVHFWQRHELESYLLIPSAIARLTGVSESDIVDKLNEVTDGMRSQVLSEMVNSRIREGDRGVMGGDYVPECEAEIATYWTNPDKRLYFCPAKEVLAGLNSILQSRRQPTLSFVALAASLKEHEIDHEVRDVLTTVEGLAGS